MKTDIVIVDSGIDKIHRMDPNIIGGVTLGCKGADNLKKDDFHDEVGHGTAIYGLITKYCPEAKIYIVKIFRNSFEVDYEVMLNALKYIYENVDTKFVILSSGMLLSGNSMLNDIVNRLFHQKNTIVVSAFNNEGAISYPAANEYVIGVDSEYGISFDGSLYKVSGSPINIMGEKHAYRVEWLEGKKIIDRGNS